MLIDLGIVESNHTHLITPFHTQFSLISAIEFRADSFRGNILP